MKKFFLIPFLTFLFIGTHGQNISRTAAKVLVTNNSALISVPKNLLDDAIVSSAYYNETAGTQMVYLLQAYKGLPVYNKMLVLAFKDGKIISSAGSFITDISKISTAISTPALTAVTATRTAFIASRLTAPVVLNPLIKLENGRKIDFGIVAGVYDNVVAELIWLPIETAGKKSSVKLTWSVLVAPENTDDYWNIMVDANSNGVIDKTNMTIYERFDKNMVTPPVVVNKLVPENFFFNTDFTDFKKQNSPLLVANANYLVIPYPFESPLYSVPTLVTNPWNLAGGGNVTSLGWHNNGITDYTITRGNNVWATEDRAGVNSNTGLPATSTTGGEPLTFNSPPDYTRGPTDSLNQLFATTNLFYWNNIMHDLSYRYGFDEAAGNFQNSNLGRGGLGNDYVTALAQSSTDVNNANFLPTPDGQRGRMRMYLFNRSTPFRDGDLDNGVINHEYTHGISTRLTGGPANPGCLSNAEEAGEGWSDYFALMTTTNWASATATDGFNLKRPIGNYVINQSPAAGGIRRYPYSTNMTINPLTYADVKSSGGEVHDIGEIWCATLWDLTWALIQTDGINANLFNSGAAGGNTAAVKIVIEGMKLQPCSPGFLDARDAILQADQNLYGGAHRCTIISVFARRGMGYDARQGSSNSTSDQVVGFSSIEPPVLQLTQNVFQQEEGLNIIYTNTIKAGRCPGSAPTNFLITDTLPANVSYISGGSYDTATRVVSFQVNQALNSTQTYSFTVKVNSGSYFLPATLFSETVPTAVFPGTFTASAPSPTWVVSAAQSHSAPNSFFAVDVNGLSDFKLTSDPIPLGSTPPVLSFWHNYDTEEGWDGGVVEISTDLDSTWTDLGSSMVKNGYNSSLGTGSSLSGRNAFTGSSKGFIETAIRLLPYANRTARFRFRTASDDNTASVGWFVDDILLKSFPIVVMRTTLFNAALERIATRDTVTQILPTTACQNAAIASQPSNLSACAGSNAFIAVSATGSVLQYQWQVSTDNGTSFTDLGGAINDTLMLSSITSAMNNNQYRVKIINGCPSSLTSSVSKLAVSMDRTFLVNPEPVTTCAGTDITFAVTASGLSPSYQWQVSTNGGTTFTNIAGQTSDTLSLVAVTASMSGNQYRAIVASCNPAGVNSAVAILTVNAPIAITSGPASVSACENANAVFTVVTNGAGPSYQWQVSTDAGANFADVSGATSATLTLNGLLTSLSGNQYRAVIKGTCTSQSLTSSTAILIVNTNLRISSQPQPSTLCAGLSTSFSVVASGSGLSYQWQVNTNGGAGWVNISGQTNSTLNVNAVTTTMNGYLYRVVLNGPCSIDLNSAAAMLTVNMPVILASQPVDASVCVGSDARFAVSALGSSIAYQWQVSENGTLFINLANNSTYDGVTSNQLIIKNAATNIHGNIYRVVASGAPCGAVTSAGAKLTVNMLPSVAATIASYQRLNPYVSTTLAAVPNPAGVYTYQWFRDGIRLANINSQSLPVNVDGFGGYSVTVTDSKGCMAFSSVVTIIDSASSLLFIYPNPNKGQFDVRYFQRGGETVKRTIVLFDATGNKVYSKEFIISGPYGRMQVSFGGVSGSYLVEVSDQRGKRLATGKIIVIR